MTTAEIFTQLDVEARGAESGVVYRRLPTSTNLDLSIVVTVPDRQYALRLGLATTTRAVLEAFPSGDGFSVLRTEAAGSRYLEIRLRDANRRDVFVRLVDDVVDCVLKGEPRNAVAVLRSRLHLWRSFFERSRDLSGERLRGLFGELVVLGDLLTCGVGAIDAVRAWVGPLQRGTDLPGSRDFRVGRLAIEVKTTAGAASDPIMISSLRQLEDIDGVVLVLARVLVDEVTAPADGQTLGGLVSSLRERISDAAAWQALADQILVAGIDLTEVDAVVDQLRWNVRDIRRYRVGPTFPRLTPDAVPSAIVSARYGIDAAACEPFAIDVATFAALALENRREG